jgi:hypothetical protein
MDGLEIVLCVFNILDEWKSQKLNELFNFGSISHLEFGCLGSIWLMK